MKKQDEGFTLIELLIVIVILGILATVVVFAVSGIRNQGDESACEAELRSVLTGIEAYYADNGSNPGGNADILPYFRTDLQYWDVAAGGHASAQGGQDVAEGTTSDDSEVCNATN